MVAEVVPEHPTLPSAIQHMASAAGMNAETLRVWVCPFEVDAAHQARSVHRRGQRDQAAPS
jgi:hypothetical protein